MCRNIRNKTGGFSPIAIPDIGALHPESLRGMNGPVSSPVGVEDGGEDGGAIEAWPAQPVDGAIARNQDGGAAVTDNALVAGLAHLLLVLSHGT